MNLDEYRRLLALERKVAPLTVAPSHWNLISPFLSLSGLVGFWPMSSVQRSTGNAYDLSGQGRTLTYNGNPAYAATSGGAAYLALDGTGDYLSRADETDLDVLGSETIYSSAVRGLTVGGWFYANAVSGAQGLVSKYTVAGGQQSYLLYLNGSTLTGSVSGTGSDDFVATVAGIPAATWIFAALRFVASTEVKVFAGSSTGVNTTSIPSAIFNSTAALQVGAFSAGTSLLTGRVSSVFLLANAVSDALLSAIYQQTRGAFGV